MKGLSTKLLSCAALLIAVFAFVFLGGHGKPVEFVTKLKFENIDSLVIAAPCIIFGLTVHAYFHYITTYRGAIAGLSFIFLLIALIFCIGLVVNSDWWMHLRYMYLLFASYVVWDILMIELLLKPERFTAEYGSDLKRDICDIKMVSFFINIPTLATIFCVSLYCAFCIQEGNVAEEAIRLFVVGVVSFHLIFSSVAYLFATHQS